MVQPLWASSTCPSNCLHTRLFPHVLYAPKHADTLTHCPRKVRLCGIFTFSDNLGKNNTLDLWALFFIFVWKVLQITWWTMTSQNAISSASLCYNLMVRIQLQKIVRLITQVNNWAVLFIFPAHEKDLWEVYKKNLALYLNVEVCIKCLCMKKNIQSTGKRSNVHGCIHSKMHIKYWFSINASCH